MSGTIENRESFLQNIASKLNRNAGEFVKTPKWTHQPQFAVGQGASRSELIEVLKNAAEAVHTKVFQTDAAGLPDQLDQVIQEYGGAPVIATKDGRFTEYGLNGIFEKYHIVTWNVNEGHKNIDQAAKANIGLSVCDVMLAESATAGLYNDKDKARSVSLLPAASIVIVPASVIVPRLTQAMQQVESDIAEGKELSHYINFISGPSNSADIEMRLVVGVHGPVKVAYVVVSDR
jgi:L-lactate dehydrogenase complex protein LldG